MKTPCIHRSTKILFGVVMLCLGFFNILGLYAGFHKSIVYGWPIVYLDRNFFASHGRVAHYWALTENVSFFSATALIADILVALAISLGIAGVGELLLQQHLRKYGACWRFGLSHLLLAMGCVAILAGLFGQMTTRAVKRSYAIRQLENAGATVRLGLIESPTRIDMLCALLSLRPRGVAKSINARHADLRDARLLSAEEFQGIESINIRDSQISDESFEVISNFSDLVAVSIANSNGGLSLSAKNFASICNIKGLCNLSLSGLDLRAVDMRALGKSNSLTQLDFFKSNLDDSQLAELAELPKLESINLSMTSVTDSGFLHLTKCKSLKCIGIGGVKVTPAAIQTVKKANPRLVINQ